jgi:hypothetical protein
MKSIFNLIVPKSAEERRAEAYREILRKSAQIGGTVFGSIPKGVRREFFCLDPHTWIWHEEWTDEHKVHHVRTTRYDVRPHGIFKAQDGQPYQPLTSVELDNFYYATQAYTQAVDGYFLPRLTSA